jgi:hypothetical protein
VKECRWHANMREGELGLGEIGKCMTKVNVDMEGGDSTICRSILIRGGLELQIQDLHPLQGSQGSQGSRSYPQNKRRQDVTATGLPWLIVRMSSPPCVSYHDVGGGADSTIGSGHVAQARKELHLGTRCTAACTKYMIYSLLRSL